MASEKLKYNDFYLSRDLMWQREQKNMWLLSLLLLIITFFICHVTWCAHVINGLCNFVDNIFSSETTSLSSVVAIGLVEMEI